MTSLEKIESIFASIMAVNEEPMVQPGLSEQEIVSSFNSVGLAPSSELVDLYQWHDGIYHLDAFLHFLSLADALEAYRGNKSLKNDIPDFEWKESWLTILDMNGDVQICLDLKTLELYSVDVECDVTSKIAENYGHYLDAILFLFQSGQYEFDEKAGCVEVKSEVWEDVLERYNIKSAWK